MNKQKLIRALILCNPFLAALYALIFLYAQNYDEVILSFVLTITSWTLTFVCLLYIITLLLIRNRRKSSLVLTVILVIFFSYNHLRSVVPSFQLFSLGGFIFGKNHLFIIAAFSGMFAASWFIIKTRSNLKPAARKITIILLILIGINILRIVIFETTHSFSAKTTGVANRLQLNKNQNTLPDIYYIILDAYAREDVLKEVYHYEDKILLPFLKQNQFIIGNKSQANYPATYLSLASSLNLNYIENLTSPNPTLTDLIELIDKNAVVKGFHQLGYTYITFNSGYNATKKSTSADVFYDYGIPIKRFGLLFVDSTLFGHLLEKLNFDYNYFHRNRVNLIFDILGRIPQNPDPTFTFAHIVSPHPPFIFDRDGNVVGQDQKFIFDDGLKLDLSKEEYKKRYREQLEYISNKTVKTIQTILQTSERPPIIIIQSDHGPASEVNREGKKKLAELKNYRDIVFDPNNEQSIKERFSILNAYYLPGNGAEKLYDSISPVNTFRAIFNQYFQGKYDYLEDQIFLDY